MKSPKRLLRIRLLMIISQLVITGFVAQWLLSQYDSEKEILTKELSRQLAEVREEVLDSMLVIHLIDPIMHGREIYTMQMDLAGDTLSCNGRVPGSDSDSLGIRAVMATSAMIRLASSDSHPVKRIESCSSSYPKAALDDVMLKSVKLIVQQASDSLHPNGFTRVMTSMVDAGMLKERFTERLRMVDKRFVPAWYDSGIADASSGQGIRFSYTGVPVDPLCSVEIRHFFWYLAGKTLPACFFGLVLLLLTGLSFLIADRTLKQQLHLNRLQGSFVSNISHELKTPVSTVKVALEAIRKSDPGMDADTAAGYLEMAEKELARLDLLITRVLHASLHEHDVRMIDPEPTDLTGLILELLDLLHPRLVQAGASVIFEPVAAPGTLMLDRIHIQGVLMNLLDNSLKYSREKPRITIRVEETDRNVDLRIMDNGIGIPDEYLEKVFDRFFRIPHGDRHDVKGYGLGLSYAAMVMEQHGGTIRARNRSEGGTEFILTIPKPAV